MSEELEEAPRKSAAAPRSHPSEPQAISAEMAQALAGLLRFFAEDGESSLEKFERIAEEYYRETRRLAPGKDEPAYGGSGLSEEARRKLFDLWVARRVDAARAALLSHASDCALHNAPALPVGPCDCGAGGVKL